jgi:hypothetical protein
LLHFLDQDDSVAQQVRVLLWWYGWKLHLAVVVGSIWTPLAAEFTIASDADNVLAPKLLEQLPLAVRYVLGDTHYNTPELR